MQLILYFIYRDNKGSPKQQEPTEGESMEMGNGKNHQMKQSYENEIQGWHVKNNLCFVTYIICNWKQEPLWFIVLLLF